MSFTKWRCLAVSTTFTVALAVGAGALLLAGDDDAGAEVGWLLVPPLAIALMMMSRIKTPIMPTAMLRPRWRLGGCIAAWTGKPWTEGLSPIAGTAVAVSWGQGVLAQAAHSWREVSSPFRWKARP